MQESFVMLFNLGGLDLFCLPVLALTDYVVGSLPTDAANVALLEAVRKRNASKLVEIIIRCGMNTAIPKAKILQIRSLAPSKEAVDAVDQIEKQQMALQQVAATSSLEMNRAKNHASSS